MKHFLIISTLKYFHKKFHLPLQETESLKYQIFPCIIIAHDANAFAKLKVLLFIKFAEEKFVKS